MSIKKKIPCRVCGKLFEPCSYCQSHSDIFRWRNFACSRECAAKYINDTIVYRESSKITEKIKQVDTEVTTTLKNQTKRKYSKKVSAKAVENEIENNETE